MKRLLDGRIAAGSGVSVRVLSITLALALTACGGGGGGGSSGSAGPPPAGGTGGTSPPPPVSPPPDPNAIVRSFRLDSAVHLGPTGGFLVNSTSIGDVTGDGRPDVVVVTEGSNPPDMYSIVIFPQAANGTLGARIQAPYLAYRGWRPTGSALADLDRDGVPEVLVAHQDGLSVGKYRPDAQTLSVSTIGDPIGYSAAAAMDVDADGNLDVVAQAHSEGAVIYKGDGNGGLTFLRKLATPLAGYNHVIARDMNADGKDDLVMTNGQGFRNWYLMFNDGAGSFSPVQSNALPSRAPDNWPWTAWGVDVGDFNRDAYKDVAVSLSSNRPAAVGIYLGQADGQFRLDRVLDSNDLPEPIAVADLDGNGLDDIVTVHGGFATMGYYLQGPAGFEPEVLVNISKPNYSPTSAYRPDGLALGDVNSDGCIDVAIADYQFGLIILAGKDCKRKQPNAANAMAGKALRAGIRSRMGG